MDPRTDASLHLRDASTRPPEWRLASQTSRGDEQGRPAASSIRRDLRIMERRALRCREYPVKSSDRTGRPFDCGQTRPSWRRSDQVGARGEPRLGFISRAGVPAFHGSERSNITSARGGSRRIWRCLTRASAWAGSVRETPVGAPFSRGRELSRWFYKNNVFPVHRPVPNCPTPL